MRWGEEVVHFGHRLNDINYIFWNQLGQKAPPLVVWTTLPLPRTPVRRRTPETVHEIVSRVLDGQDRRAKTYAETDIAALVEDYAAMDNDLIGLRQEMRRCLQDIELHPYHQPEVTGERERRSERRLREIRSEMLALAEVYRAYLERVFDLWVLLFDSGLEPPAPMQRRDDGKIIR